MVYHLHGAIEVRNRNNLATNKVVEAIVCSRVNEAVANPNRSLDLVLNLAKGFLVDRSLDALVPNGLTRGEVRGNNVGVVLEDVIPRRDVM
jgi:hypothetical protein